MTTPEHVTLRLFRFDPSVDTAPRYETYQVPYSDQVRRETGATTMTVGLILDPHQAEAILRDGKADLVAIGREALFNPNWARQAAVALAGDDAFETHWPDRDGWWLVRRARSLAADAAASGED